MADRPTRSDFRMSASHSRVHAWISTKPNGGASFAQPEILAPLGLTKVELIYVAKKDF